MRIKIRDWDKYFEADRSRQWKHLSWVPTPNKQGLGYKKIMAQKNGAEIFGCWNAVIQQASLCEPRGDLSKYTIEDLSLNTLIPLTILKNAINYIVQTLDWIEVIDNLDKNVNDDDVSRPVKDVVSSCNTCNTCNPLLPESQTKPPRKKEKKEFNPPTEIEVIEYFKQNGYSEESAKRFFNSYTVSNWYDSRGNPVLNWKQKAQMVWFKPENKKPDQKQSEDRWKFLESK